MAKNIFATLGISLWDEGLPRNQVRKEYFQDLAEDCVALDTNLSGPQLDLEQKWTVENKQR
jgi:hypothetical protein